VGLLTGEGLRKQLEALIEPTKREKGCRRYSLMQDLQTLFSQLPELLAAPPKIVRYKQIG
jgi:quinol monooxygenase YgiN